MFRHVIAGLENREREATGIANLKVRYNKVFGYFIEVTKTHLAAVPERYLRKQTLVNCERFITPELKEYEEKVLSAEERILELERELFTQVRDRLASHASRIQQTAKTLALLDVLLCFAEKLTAATTYALSWKNRPDFTSLPAAIRAGTPLGRAFCAQRSPLRCRRRSTLDFNRSQYGR